MFKNVVLLYFDVSLLQIKRKKIVSLVVEEIEGTGTFSLSLCFFMFLPVHKEKQSLRLDKELRAGRPNRDFEPLCLESLTEIQITAQPASGSR